ncbi:ATP-citrate synthase beta chain protein 2 [Artemisia annua]|uniref:ATP-citrate synthase beta chain protein 2 n=1 Tax=Artemisia annua TaxID=35608 RepID=A0A2U1M0K0_ARTAN|nr:ATP-citrate synthase beta chain protein 2 [Artemisia annua]
MFGDNKLLENQDLKGAYAIQVEALLKQQQGGVPIVPHLLEANRKLEHVTLEYEPNSVDTKYGSENHLAPLDCECLVLNKARDKVEFRYCNNKKWQLPKVVIRPATVSGIQVGAFKIGDTAGTIDNIIHCKFYRTETVGFVSKSDTNLYVTLKPCLMYAGAKLQARIDTVVWGAPNKLLDADASWVRQAHQALKMQDLQREPNGNGNFGHVYIARKRRS